MFLWVPMRHPAANHSVNFRPITLWRGLPVLVAVTWVLAAATHQTPPHASQAQSQSQAPPAIRSKSELIVVRVIVRDAKGNPVAGLTKNDFLLNRAH